MTSPKYPWHKIEEDLAPTIKERVKMSIWKKYRKIALQEMRDYICGEDLSNISVARGEVPKKGGKIARDNKGSQWYITPEFLSENYELDKPVSLSREQKFVKHIEKHLCNTDQYVICKICGKSIDDINEE